MLWGTKTENINLSTKPALIRNYNIASMKENVINPATTKFHEHFINRRDGLTEGAKELRKHLLQFSQNVENLEQRIFNFD
jgi:hypothetical protein